MAEILALRVEGERGCGHGRRSVGFIERMHCKVLEQVESKCKISPSA